MREIKCRGHGGGGALAWLGCLAVVVSSFQGPEVVLGALRALLQVPGPAMPPGAGVGRGCPWGFILRRFKEKIPDRSQRVAFGGREQLCSTSRSCFTCQFVLCPSGRCLSPPNCSGLAWGKSVVIFFF